VEIKIIIIIVGRISNEMLCIPTKTRFNYNLLFIENYMVNIVVIFCKIITYWLIFKGFRVGIMKRVALI